MELYTDSTGIDANEVKKILYKTKAMAKFSHYISGNLYYVIEISEGYTYQFPISTVDQVSNPLHDYLDGIGATYDPGNVEPLYDLSKDLGQTIFSAEIKGSELNRWIAKACENGTFIRIK